MFLRKHWIGLTVFLVAIVGIGLYLLSIQPPKDPIVIYKPVEPLPKSEVKAPVGDTSQDGHFHADGTWHEGPHEAPPTAEVSEPLTPEASERENKPLADITFEEYEKKVTQEWNNLPRNEWGIPLTSLPDTPGEAGRWSSFEELLRAGRVWHKLNAEEAKRFDDAHRRMQAHFSAQGGNSQ